MVETQARLTILQKNMDISPLLCYILLNRKGDTEK